jgi:hypothetical protein
MNTPDIILLSLAGVGSIAFPIWMFSSRRRLYETWARVVSVCVCIFGLGYAVSGFILAHLEASSSGSAHIVLIMMRSFCCGVGSGLLLSILIARPYKKVTHEKP